MKISVSVNIKTLNEESLSRYLEQIWACEKADCVF